MSETKTATFEVCIVAEYHGWVEYEVDDDVVLDDPGEEELCAWATKKILKSTNLRLDTPGLMQVEHVSEIRLESLD